MPKPGIMLTVLDARPVPGGRNNPDAVNARVNVRVEVVGVVDMPFDFDINGMLLRRDASGEYHLNEPLGWRNFKAFRAGEHLLAAIKRYLISEDTITSMIKEPPCRKSRFEAKMV